MAAIDVRSIHHVVLTVTEVSRSEDFYREVLGFERAAVFGPRVLLAKGDMILVLGPAPDPSKAIPGDRFDPNRLGLDHLSFAVSSRTELEQAKDYFEEAGIEHRYVKELEGVGICVLAFRDPDGIALELTAPA